MKKKMLVERHPEWFAPESRTMKEPKGTCAMCGGTGKMDAVWYGQPTGKKAKCQLCNGTGKSNAIRLI